MKKQYILALLCLFSINIFSKDNELQKRIDDILRTVPAGTKYGVMVYNPLKKDTIYGKNISTLLIPASNAKLYTTGAALASMGGDYQISTKLFTDDSNLSDGIINGNLYIKGFGNSVFTDRDLDSIVNRLVRRKIHKITGRVIGDDTYFDDIYHRKDWIPEEESSIPLAPVSALVVNRNRIQFSFDAASKVGKPVNYNFYPRCSLIRVKVNAITTKGRSSVSISQRITDGQYEFIVNGGVRRKSHIIWYSADVDNPPLFAAYLLMDKLVKAGINVAQKPSAGPVPIRVHEVENYFITLRDLLKIINKHSDNYLAECLFKTLGAFYSHTQGNSFYATQAITTFLKNNGIFSDGISVVDGSGLSHFNQVTISSLVELLERIYLDNKIYPDYFNSLSIAGIDGTLRGRMIGSNAENNFHGKTGTLNGVIALSGYLTSKKKEDLIVSIIFEYDKGNAHKYRAVEDQIIKALAE